MKLKTRIQEVEAILITEAIGALKISSNRNVLTTELVVDVGEYLIFDPVRGLQRMDANEVKKLYTSASGHAVPEIAPVTTKKETRSKQPGLGPNRATTSARKVNGSDGPSHQAEATTT